MTERKPRPGCDPNYPEIEDWEGMEDETNGATPEELEEYYSERDDYDEDEEPYLGDWPPPEWRNPELLAWLAEHEQDKPPLPGRQPDGGAGAEGGEAKN